MDDFCLRVTPFTEFLVAGFPPVPWTVPNVGTGYSKTGKRFRFTTRSKKTKTSESGRMTLSLKDWQKAAALRAKAAMQGRTPTVEQVRFEVIFLYKAPKKSLIGTIPPTPVEWIDGVCVKHTTAPDLTNLVKGLEDALEGIVYANDVLVRSNGCLCVYASVPGALIRVGLLKSVAATACETNSSGNTLFATPSKGRAKRSTAKMRPAPQQPIE
jgi:Holliday junction resolvase RusA-like endonuclease